MLQVINVSKQQSGQEILSKINFTINAGEKVGLVGPNGAGKTTIFRIIVGQERADEGQISLLNQARLAYFSQSVGEMSGTTALEEVMAGHVRAQELAALIRQCEEDLCDPQIDENQMNSLLVKMGDAQTEFEKLGGYDLESRAQEILTGLGISPEEHFKCVEDFSGGWKMRIALAKVLICSPDLILMDEPTNYLDMETILWLEQWLIDFKGAILLTTHDREFMNRVTNRILEIARAKLTLFTGNYDFYMQEKEVRKTQNEAQVSRQQSMLKKEEEFIARFAARASHAAQVQSRVKKLEKIERVELDAEETAMTILLPPIPRGGNDVAMAKSLGKHWVDSTGKVKEVFSNASFTISRQAKVAVVGVNGAGKSTLLKILNGQTEATSGTVQLGPTIQIGYFGQHTLDVLNPQNSVYEEVLSKLPQKSDALIRSLLAAFLFRGDEVHKKIRVLSGGEKARVVLACILSGPNNFLILDEPTNHLDIKSREVLLDALKRYEGTLAIVSHDRYFLHQIATQVLEIDRGSTFLYPGSYQEYLEHRGARAK